MLESSKLRAKPVAIERLEHKLVLWRDAKGKVVIQTFSPDHIAIVFFNRRESMKSSFFFVRDLNLAQNDSYNPLIRSETCSVDRKSNGAFVRKKSRPKSRSRKKVRAFF